MANRNENLVATFLEVPISNPPIMVDAHLYIPGIRARHWNIPIWNTSLYFNDMIVLLSLFVVLYFSTNIRVIPPNINVIATFNGLKNKASTYSPSKKPKKCRRYKSYNNLFSNSNRSLNVIIFFMNLIKLQIPIVYYYCKYRT